MSSIPWSLVIIVRFLSRVHKLNFCSSLDMYVVITETAKPQQHMWNAVGLELVGAWEKG
jgi:hypothetical protein